MTTYPITKRRRHLCILCLTSLLACACTADPNVSTDNAPVPLRIGNVSLENETADTRATTRLTEGSIGVFLIPNKTPPSTIATYNNIEYKTADNGVSWSAAATPIYVSSKPMSIVAYYPHRQMTDKALSLQAGIYNANRDLVYDRSQTADAAAPTVNFRMKHAYGRLKIQMKRGTYDGKGELTKVALYYLVSSSTFDLGTGVYSDTKGSNGETITISVNPTVTIGATSQEIKDFLLPPCESYTFSPGELRCVIDGETLSVALGKAFFPEPGVLKTVTVTLNGKALAITGADIEDWEPESKSLTPEWD